jgi:hypothetical protein
MRAKTIGNRRLDRVGECCSVLRNSIKCTDLDYSDELIQSQLKITARAILSILKTEDNLQGPAMEDERDY